MLTSKILHLAAAGISLLALSPVSVFSQDASCIPNPSRPIDAEEVYLTVELSEPNNQTNQVLQSALEGAITQAYTDEATSCTFGSSRSLTNCTLILDKVEFIAGALLVSCLYESNSIDGDIFLADADAYTPCTCPCGDPPTDFPSLIGFDGGCSCSCIGDTAECVCYPPSEETYLEIINEVYQSTTDEIGRNVSMVGISILEVFDCGTKGYTYNTTTVCLPTTSEPTTSPTPSPTEDPNRPTLTPTRRPSKKPTRRPTSAPTDKPTAKPTKKPSKPPTNKPTHAPTVQPTICEEVCNGHYAHWYSQLCHLLKENDLCDALDDTGATYTLFAPINDAFHNFYDLDLDAYNPLDIKDVLLNHVISGTDETVASLGCGEKFTMLSGEKTTTKCNEEDARRVLAGPELKTTKFQMGKGNSEFGTKPEIWPTFLQTKNGNILEVDEIIIPELSKQTEHPTKKPTELPTPSPTAKPTEHPTKKPTELPTPSPTACVEDNKEFFYNGDATRNCPYVAKKPDKRCSKKGAAVACCLTCKNI